MKDYVGRSVVVCLALALLLRSGFSQSSDPHPPPPRGDSADGPSLEAEPREPALDSLVVLDPSAVAVEQRAGWVRRVAQAVLPQEQLSIVYRVEERAAVLGPLADGQVAIAAVRYQRLAWEMVTEDFFERVTDFLVTDGRTYLQIVLGKPTPASWAGGWPVRR